MLCRGCGGGEHCFRDFVLTGAVDFGNGGLELYYIFGGLRGG